MRTLIGVMTALLLGLGAHPATLTVGPGPSYDFPRLEEAVWAARPGDTILIAPGTYTDIREIIIPFPLILKAAGEASLSGPEDLSDKHTLFKVQTTGPVAFHGLRFRHAGTAVRLVEPAEVSIIGCGFEECGRGIVIERGKASIRDSTFQGCGIAVEVKAGGVAEIEGSDFSGNGIGVVGEHPCRVSGGENTFSENALDLLGDVDPCLRPSLRDASEETVRYPEGGYGSLQEAIDALRPGGMLLLTAPVRESAVAGKDLRIEPAAAGRLSCRGGELDIPFLAVVGEVEVWLSRLTVYGLACGPQAALRLSDVQILPDKLVLTGRAKVYWERGYGGLKLLRDARAEVEGVQLILGVELHDRAVASLRNCELAGLPTGEAIMLDGLAELKGAELAVRGGISVEDWAKLSLSCSQAAGPPAREWGPKAVLELGSFVTVDLQEVEVVGGEVGILLPASGKPTVTLNGVEVRDAGLGLAINIRCPELDELYGLWLPPLSLDMEVGPEGISFGGCASAVCPVCSLKLWPPDFCLNTGLVPREIPADTQTLIEDLEKKRVEIRSLRARYKTNLLPERELGHIIETEILFAQPDRFKLAHGVEGLAREIIVSDGETLWEYIPYLKRAEKIDLARIRREHPERWQRVCPDETRRLWDGGLGSIYLPSIAFLGTESLDGVTTYVFEGLPARGLAAGITRVRAWIGEDGIWRRIECYVGEELYTVAELEVLELNEAIPESEFTLELPCDVQVYDVTEQVLLELR